MVGSALEVLKIAENSFKINLPNFLSILKKVGDVPLVLYSINGKTRTGKSFALNYFIRYFEAQKAQVRDWVNFDTQGKFVWQSGRERTTKGINLWSEPYFVQDPQNNGRKVAVLLMDTQGLFDEQTTPRQNAIIFALSSLCSSVSIFNLMKNVDESVLQELEYYADYAHHVSAADRRSKDGVKEEAFQMLVFLVRDFDFPEYNYGVHDMHSTKPTSPNNFCRDIFETNGKRQVDEQNLLVRENILKAYKDVAMCLMPYPGSKFVRQEGQLIRPDSDFDENMTNFVQVMTSPSHLVTKKMGGVELSGTDFAKYVKGWAKLFEDSANSFPKAMTVAQANAAIQNTLVCKTAFGNFEKSLQEVMDGRPDGMRDREFQENFRKFRDEALTYFDMTEKLGDGILHGHHRDTLVEQIDQSGLAISKANSLKLAAASAARRDREIEWEMGQLRLKMDEERRSRNHEIKRQAVSWSSFSSGQFPHDALIGGWEQGHRLLVVRASYQFALIPGKLQTCQSRAQLPMEGNKVEVEHYEVLRDPFDVLEWQPSSFGVEIGDAVSGGFSENQERLYIGRFRKDGWLIPGIVHPSRRCCYVCYGNYVYSSYSYEILVNPPYRRR